MLRLHRQAVRQRITVQLVELSRVPFIVQRHPEIQREWQGFDEPVPSVRVQPSAMHWLVVTVS